MFDARPLRQPIILEWSLWLLQTASSALPIDLTQPGMVSSTTYGFNLVSVPRRVLGAPPPKLFKILPRNLTRY